MTTSMFLPSHLSEICPTNLSQTALATPVITKWFQCVPFRRVEGGERKLWLHISQQKLDMHFPVISLETVEWSRKEFLVGVHIFSVQFSWNTTYTCGSSSKMPYEAQSQCKHQVCLPYIE